MVGEEEVLQQTPVAVREAPPLEVTLPPPIAVVEVKDPIAAVVTTGKETQEAVVCVRDVGAERQPEALYAHT